MNTANIPVNVPLDDPNADTEWNDILRKHGVIPEKPPSPTSMIQEALEEARNLAHENRLEGKDIDELAELEEDEDEAFLEQYRRRRVKELSNIAQTAIYNQVFHLQKPDYSKDVTEASRKSFVLVLLTSSHGIDPETALLVEAWSVLARRFGDIKFCQMQADMCIEGYPERNTPTILVYKDGNIKKQVVTLRELRGVHTNHQGCHVTAPNDTDEMNTPDIEKLFLEVGALGPNDPRLHQHGDQRSDELLRTCSNVEQSSQGLNSKIDQASDDSDWD
ncbi:thioredoxin-like protein [Patellaria atrata CBS 101060]|uniref:Thioredoxin-like protein n=1 Tax=Patellaria atrata CBS 101060 TaxID=1346257 RepID=A0A9P4VIN5_9PEZI|nr:thioredoxin-like protein [Patellaria atrata CBS 101060]